MNRLKELREQKHLTLQELGDKLGLANNTLSQYETGKRQPRLETWQKLADFFNVSVPYLQGIDVEGFGSKAKELEKENKELREQLAVYKRELGMIVMSIPNVDEMILDFEEENHIKNGYGASWEDEEDESKTY